MPNSFFFHFQVSDLKRLEKPPVSLILNCGESQYRLTNSCRCRGFPSVEDLYTLLFVYFFVYIYRKYWNSQSSSWYKGLLTVARLMELRSLSVFFVWYLWWGFIWRENRFVTLAGGTCAVDPFCNWRGNTT